jgi:WSC domain
MYQLNGTISTSSSTTIGSTTIATTTISTTSSTSTTSVSISTPTTTGLPTGWSYQGCYIDGVNGRILGDQLADNAGLTIESCVQACAAAGYTIAGAEFSVQCFCSNVIYNGGALAANQADCSMACGGNSAEICGAGGRLSLYSLGTPQVFQPPGPQKTGLPPNWAYQGCLQSVYTNSQAS